MPTYEGLLQQNFQNYSEYHTTRGNQISHNIGIPLIVVTLLGLLSWITVGPTDVGLLFWVLITLWYVKLSFAGGKLSKANVSVTIPFSLAALAAYFLGRSLPGVVLWTAFILGWIAQGIGHYKYEKRSPAFFTNLRHLFIGPLWIFSKLYK